MLRKLNPNVLLVILIVVLLTILYHNTQGRTPTPLTQNIQALTIPSAAASRDVRQSLFLTEEQCVDAFPAFDKEIKKAVAQGLFQLTRLRDDTPGLVQGRIKNGKVRVFKNGSTRSYTNLSRTQVVYNIRPEGQHTARKFSLPLL
jgi:hypothetical protein